MCYILLREETDVFDCLQNGNQQLKKDWTPPNSPFPSSYTTFLH